MAGVIVASLRKRGEVRFKTYDEINVVQQLMFWSAKRMPGSEGHKLAIKAYGLSNHLIIAIQSISRHDLAVIAPVIDEWIQGRLPPQNLPAEYEDFRPRTLQAFKARMQTEGLWPNIEA
ncbi:hypothetical protein [Bradyrhizobium jicamae]|uniref:hypothetical protein n=1 Tax=Bradyrhizobium jicamae TaxID=280332 RepID=UPI001BA7977B|nr:hypothetical protein [Bradyrhizobium jicamae]